MSKTELLTPPDPTIIYTTTLIAERHGVTDEAVRLWIVTGQLPARKIGRSWTVKPEDLSEFENRRKAK